MKSTHLIEHGFCKESLLFYNSNRFLLGCQFQEL